MRYGITNTEAPPLARLVCWTGADNDGGFWNVVTAEPREYCDAQADAKMIADALSVAENLTAIVQRLGVAIITTRESRMRDAIGGWCISDGGATEVCADTVAKAAEMLVALLEAEAEECAE